jgi:hypothetical protein
MALYLHAVVTHALRQRAAVSDGGLALLDELGHDLLPLPGLWFGLPKSLGHVGPGWAPLTTGEDASSSSAARRTEMSTLLAWEGFEAMTRAKQAFIAGLQRTAPAKVDLAVHPRRARADVDGGGLPPTPPLCSSTSFYTTPSRTASKSATSD